MNAMNDLSREKEKKKQLKENWWVQKRGQTVCRERRSEIQFRRNLSDAFDWTSSKCSNSLFGSCVCTLSNYINTISNELLISIIFDFAIILACTSSIFISMSNWLSKSYTREEKLNETKLSKWNQFSSLAARARIRTQVGEKLCFSREFRYEIGESTIATHSVFSQNARANETISEILSFTANDFVFAFARYETCALCFYFINSYP